MIVLHHFGKEFAQEIIIGRFLETKFADIIEVDAELLCGSHDERRQKQPNKVIGLPQFTRIAFAEFLYKRRLLLLTDLFVLLLVRRRLEALPRQASAEEVHENVTKRLEIITSRLFCASFRSRNHAQTGNHHTSTQVSVDAHVSRGATQTLAFAIRYVLLRLWVAVLLGHSEIHDVNHWLPGQRIAYESRGIREGERKT